MQHLRRKLLFELYKLMDLSVMIIVLAIVLFFFSAAPEEQLRHPLSFFTIKIKLVNVILLSLILIVWPVIFSFFGLYHSQRLGNLRNEFLNVLKAVGFGTLLFASMSFLFNRENITQQTVIAFWILCSSATFLSRFFLRKILFKLRKHGRNLRNVIVVGNGKRGQDLVSKIIKKKGTGYNLVGFVDDNPKLFENNQEAKFVCELDELPEYLGNHIVDEVFVTLPMKSYYSEISDIVETCEQQGIPVHIPLDLFKVNIAKVKSEVLDTFSFVVHSPSHNLDLRILFFKRVMDIVFSLLLFIPCLPIFVIIAFLIKLTSKGSVFFIQERVGFNKRKFKLIKFRTMVKNAEELLPTMEHLNEVDGPIFKIKDDPRLTKLGKFLRKTSMDELPQLINVIKGDMSLVGPRPLPVRDVNLFEELRAKRRFSIRPGVTGLWQIRGRSEVQFEKLIKYDLEYIDNWSPWLDVKILLKTIPVVIEGIGAM